MSSGPERQQENRRDEEPARRTTDGDPPAPDARGGGPRAGDLRRGTGRPREDHLGDAPDHRHRRREPYWRVPHEDHDQQRPDRRRTGEGTGQPPAGGPSPERGRGGGGARPGQSTEPPAGHREQPTERGRPNSGEGHPGPAPERSGRPGERHPGPGDGHAPERPRGASRENGGGFEPSWTPPSQQRRYVDGWSIGTREQWEQRNRGNRPEQGEGHPAPPAGGRPPTREAGTAAQEHQPQQMSSRDAADRNPVSNPYQRLEERHHASGRDGTEGMKQSGQGHTSPPQTDFSRSLTDSRDKSAGGSQDQHKPPSDSGPGGHRP